MAFTIEYRSSGSKIWSETPTKDWVKYDPAYTSDEDNPWEDFRIITDKLEEFGEAIDKFEAESRMVEYYFDRTYIDRYVYDISTFPARENGRWVKYGRVFWKDMSIELKRKKDMEALKRKRAREKKKKEKIQKLKDQIKELGG